LRNDQMIVGHIKVTLLLIEKEPLIPRDQSQISVERSTSPAPVVRPHRPTQSLYGCL